MHKEENDKLEKMILNLEGKIEEIEDFYIENQEEFKKLNEELLEKHQELIGWFEHPYEEKMSDKIIDLIRVQVKRFNKLTSRINQIQYAAGIETQDDINSMMFPNDEDDKNDD